MSIGSLVVDLQADIAKFASAMDKATAIAQQRAEQIDKSLSIVKTSLATLGVGFVSGLTVDAIKNKIESTIQAAASLQEVSERTGVTADRISALAAVAKMSGTDTEAMATGLQKLSKTMVDAQDGGSKSAAAFEAIGISVRDLKGMKPDEVFQLVAQKLSLYADGAGKTALAQAMLGKAGANLLPVMKDVADVGDLQVKLTADQIQQANEYERTMKRLDAAQGAIFKTIATEAVPVLNAFAKAMLDSATQTDGVKGQVDKLAKDGSIRDWAESAARTVGFVIDAFDGVQRVVQVTAKALAATLASINALGEGGGVFSKAGRAAFSAVWEGFNQDADAVLNATLFSTRLNQQLEKMHARGKGTGADRPELPFKPNSGGGSTDDPARAQLQGVIKTQELIVSAARKALTENEQMLQQSYQLQYLSATQYLEAKKQLIQEELDIELAAYSKEMDAAQRYIDQADSEVKRQQGRNQLAEAAGKYMNAQAEAQTKLAKASNDYMVPLRQFELATKDVIYQYGLQNQAMDFQLSLLGKSTLEVQQLTAARQIDLALQQRIHELQLKGYDADKTAGLIAQATAEAEAQKAIVVAKTAAAYDAQRTAVFGADEAVRKYIEDSSNMAAQLENVVTTAFKGMEDALVNFVKTGKLDFRSLAESIISDLIRIQVQASITKPLASAISGSGGFAGLFSGLFGNGGPGAGFSSDAALLSYVTGTRAQGGGVTAGMPYLVGENGPEVVVPNTAATVLPNSSIGGASRITIVNQTSAPIGQVTERQISPSERVLIIEEAMQTTAALMNNPNSPISKSLQRNFTATRRR